MIIDFHAHVFPDKIAKSTIDYLAERGGIQPSTDGTKIGLEKAIETAGISLAVCLPVLTKPSQFDSVLSFAVSLNDEYKGQKLLSFAGIHPDCENLEDKLLAVKNAGIKGVKIHPDYQSTEIDDDRYIKILQIAKELDLIVVTHAGIDCAYKDCKAMCPPDKARKVIDKVGHKKFVLAHMGGSEMVDEFLSSCAGCDVFIDTSFVLKHLTKEQFLSILTKHGEDKILFATDSPWSDGAEDVKILRSFVDDERVLEKILYKNALGLLGL